MQPLSFVSVQNTLISSPLKYTPELGLIVPPFLVMVSIIGRVTDFIHDSTYVFIWLLRVVSNDFLMLDSVTVSVEIFLIYVKKRAIRINIIPRIIKTVI
jgi:hypothetical protein